MQKEEEYFKTERQNLIPQFKNSTNDINFEKNEKHDFKIKVKICCSIRLFALTLFCPGLARLCQEVLKFKKKKYFCLVFNPILRGFGRILPRGLKI